MALTRMPILEKCTASHCVKLEMAAFAPRIRWDFGERRVRVHGRNVQNVAAIAAEHVPPAKACVGRSVPRKLRLKTNSTPFCSRSKKRFRLGVQIARFIVFPLSASWLWDCCRPRNWSRMSHGVRSRDSPDGRPPWSPRNRDVAFISHTPPFAVISSATFCGLFVEVRL